MEQKDCAEPVSPKILSACFSLSTWLNTSVFRNHISNCFKVILTPLEQNILNVNPTEDFLNLEL